MSPKAIQVGKTYVNKGAGRTRRTVIEILARAYSGRRGYSVPWNSRRPCPYTQVVVYEQAGQRHTLYLEPFAAWAGREA